MRLSGEIAPTMKRAIVREGLERENSDSFVENLIKRVWRVLSVDTPGQFIWRRGFVEI